MNGGPGIFEVDWDRHQSGMVLNALAELAFKDVFEVIGKINEQAYRHFGNGADPSSKKTFLLSRRELGTCLDALQEMPYRAVRETASAIEALVGEPGGIEAAP